MKGQVISNSNKTKAIYGGQTLVTPIWFNPNGEQVKTFKNLPEDFDIKEEPKYVRTISGKDYQQVSLLFSFNPAKLLNNDSHYASAYASYAFSVSKELVQGKPKEVDGTTIPGKYQVIDNHNRVGWIHVEAGETPAEAIYKLSKRTEMDETGIVHLSTAGYKYKEKDPILRIAKENLNDMHVRIAKVGEVVLYELLFNMSKLTRYRAIPANPSREMEFYLGNSPADASAEFDKIADGDMTILNSLLVNYPVASDTRSMFTNVDKEGKLVQIPVGVLLGGRTSNGTLYQDVYTPASHMNFSTPCTFREDAKPYAKDGKELFISSELYKQVTDANYPWTSAVTPDYKFGVVTMETKATTVSMPGAAMPGAPTAMGFGAVEEDDMPF